MQAREMEKKERDGLIDRKTHRETEKKESEREEREKEYECVTLPTDPPVIPIDIDVV